MIVFFDSRYVREGMIRLYIIEVKYKKTVFWNDTKGRAISKSDKILEMVRRPGSHMVNLLNNNNKTSLMNRTITLILKVLYGVNKKEFK